MTLRNPSIKAVNKDSAALASRPASGHARGRAWDWGVDRPAGQETALRSPAGSLGFADVPVRHRSAQPGLAGSVSDESPAASGGGGAVLPLAQNVSLPPRIGSIDVVDSASGAVGGYPPVTTGDLNSPGPFNHPSNGGVSNVHQIHFTLSQGDSAFVTPRREIQRSAWFAGTENRNPADKPASPGSGGSPTPGGFNGSGVGPAGPSAHEVQRPSSSRIVVADAPGAASLPAASFPFIYRSHFSVTLAAQGVDIARIKYDVRIEKTNKANVPNVENSIAAVDKVDLVKGLSLQ